jgi:hypothetical protein
MQLQIRLNDQLKIGIEIFPPYPEEAVNGGVFSDRSGGREEGGGRGIGMVLNSQKGDNPKQGFLIPSFYIRVPRELADATKIMTDGNFLPGFRLFSILSLALSPSPAAYGGK